MPSLNWLGKDAVLNHHLDVPYKTLELKDSFNCEKGSSENKIIHGDNLEALKALMPEYEGKIKCIYIDPPYNTGESPEKGGWIYYDDVNSPKIRKWFGKVVGKEFEDFSRHDKWLCMMYPRLKLLRKLLCEDGAIFISIDDNEVANLKLICDEIFGAGNFVGEWHWFKSATPPNLSHKIKKNLEYILAYEKRKNNVIYRGIKKESKSDDPIIKPQNSMKILTFAPGTIYFKDTPDGIISAGIYGTEKYPNKLLNDAIVENGVNKNEISFENRFTWLQEKLEEELRAGTRVSCSKQLVISYKKQDYAPEVPPNLIDASVGVDTTEEAGKQLDQIFGKDKVFNYPKSPSLVEYILNFLCDKSSIILDSFAGSGTTAHAVLNLNKQDGGNRKFILVEMEDYADSITAERVRRVIKGYTTTKEHKTSLYAKKLSLANLSKVDLFVNEMNDKEIKEEKNYNKIKKSLIDGELNLIGITSTLENVPGTGGDFNYYELGPEMLLDGSLNEEQPLENIRNYIYYTETNSVIDSADIAKNGNEFFLGNHDNAAYYLFYKKSEITTLDFEFLGTISQKAERYVIYADNCVLPKDFLFKNNIVFKKIPRDVRKF